MIRIMFAIFALCMVSLSAQPNVVLIIVDDLGAYTCAPYGCDTNLTPNIDSIATDGVRFINMNSYSSCAPSRAALLTGRGSLRTGVTHPTFFSALSTNETTLATVLNDVGYRTGVFAKWNLWDGTYFDTQDEAILFHGFETNLCFEGATITYGDGSSNETYNPYLYNQAALSFLDANYDEPFFLYYALGLAHLPYNVPTPLNPSFTGDDTGFFWEYMKYADLCVSNVLDRLETLGVADNTIVIFTADNGTASTVDTSYNGSPVVGGKASDDETAFWVPFYIKWDGNISAGTTFSGLSQFEDVAVSIAEMCNVSMPVDRLIDGKSFYRSITSTNEWYRNEVFMGAHFSSLSYSKTTEYKSLSNGSSFDLYSTTNRPFGDELLSSYPVGEANKKVVLDFNTNNETNRVFGDRPWGGSTNEFILHIP